MIELIAKPKGYRTFSVGKYFNEVTDTFVTHNSSKDLVTSEADTVVTVHHAEEKELKAFVKSLVLRDETIEFEELLKTFTRTLRPDNQGDRSWLENRLGYITGSSTPFDSTGRPIPTFSSYVAKKATEEFYKIIGKGYLQEEIERTDNIITSPKTFMMERGNALENDALEEYARVKNVVVKSYGFCNIHQRDLGVSVDGEALNPISMRHLSLVEAKCPKMATYADHLINRTLLVVYNKQFQLQMLVMGKRQVDLVVYYPRMKAIIDSVEFDMQYNINMMKTTLRFEREKKILLRALMLNIA